MFRGLSLTARRRGALRVAGWILMAMGVLVSAKEYRLYERLAVWPEIDRVWSRSPPQSTAPFWLHADSVVSRPSEPRLARYIDDVLAGRFDAGSVRTYHAIPLVEFLRLRGTEIGRGDYLTITNLRGERLYLTRAEIARDQPVIVIGLDDRRELFALYQRYKMKRADSWNEPRVPTAWMARPLGAFLFYPKAPPSELTPTPRSLFSLTYDGFALSDEDPLSRVRDVPNSVASLVFGTTNSCLTCHTLRGAGAHGHHIAGSTGNASGGFALPLESYPREVTRRFLFDQAAVAREIGATPFEFDRDTAETLYRTITASR